MPCWRKVVVMGKAGTLGLQSWSGPEVAETVCTFDICDDDLLDITPSNQADLFGFDVYVCIPNQTMCYKMLIVILHSIQIQNDHQIHHRGFDCLQPILSQSENRQTIPLLPSIECATDYED